MIASAARGAWPTSSCPEFLKEGLGGQGLSCTPTASVVGENGDWAGDAVVDCTRHWMPSSCEPMSQRRDDQGSAAKAVSPQSFIISALATSVRTSWGIQWRVQVDDGVACPSPFSPTTTAVGVQES